MRKSIWSILGVVMSIGVVAAGCSKRLPPATLAPARAVEPAALPVPAPPPPPPVAVKPDTPPTPTEDEVFARKTLAELNAEMPLGDVFFDFDQAAVTGESRSTLQRNAAWFERWRSTSVIVEGHADARGTNEYNLALGDRRATAVRNYLVSLGVPANRLMAVTKGEEAPLCVEEAESCWWQNRRGHFVITKK
jgi:peptidoglycan-associated lipoprotein